MKGEGIRWLVFIHDFGWRTWLTPPSFPRKRESTGLPIWERGRPARNAARKRGDTLTLALSHKGRGDPLAAIRT